MSRDEGLRRSLEKRRAAKADYEAKLLDAINEFIEHWHRERRGNDGPTDRHIAEHLTALGFRSPRGLKIRSTSIHRLLEEHGWNAAPAVRVESVEETLAAFGLTK